MCIRDRFENNVLNVGHLKADDATANEQEVYNAFLVKASEIFATIKNELLSDCLLYLSLIHI